MCKKTIVVGSGISGLSAALSIAKAGGCVTLVAPEPSERAQSVMAAGGINASGIAPDDKDSYHLHKEETLAGGCYIDDENAIEGLCLHAPKIIADLEKMGMVFTRDAQGHILTRAFGGQSRDRTVFSGASTGKQIVSTLNRQLRHYEAKGLVTRLFHTYFYQAAIENNQIYGALCFDEFKNEVFYIEADALIIASGGQNILFGKTTGSTLCDGGAAAALFQQGIPLKNLEMVQYHPTTIETSNKRMLITEGARGEGGRLFYYKNDKPFYFMEEKYGPKGNLMPRDVVSREIYSSGEKVFLDISFLDEQHIENRLSEVRELCRSYLQLDVCTQPIPIEPSVHFFMGGIAVDINHATSVRGLYAVGECASIYHGANRLGGNSLLAAIYSGNVAAKHCMSLPDINKKSDTDFSTLATQKSEYIHAHQSEESNFSPVFILKEIELIMQNALGIARSEDKLLSGIEDIEFYISVNKKIIYNTHIQKYRVIMMDNYLILAKAILISALARKESRGAHYRLDYPKPLTAYCAASLATYEKNEVSIAFIKKGESLC